MRPVSITIIFSVLSILYSQMAEDFQLRNATPHPHPTTPSQCEFRVFTRLTGEPFTDARAALPSLFSSIIYCAQARKCTELHTHQFLTFCSHTDLSQLLTILSAVAPHDLGVSTAPDPSQPLTLQH